MGWELWQCEGGSGVDGSAEKRCRRTNNGGLGIGSYFVRFAVLASFVVLVVVDDTPLLRCTLSRSSGCMFVILLGALNGVGWKPLVGEGGRSRWRGTSGGPGGGCGYCRGGGLEREGSGEGKETAPYTYVVGLNTCT